MIEGASQVNSSGNDEGCQELVKCVAVLRRKVPKECAECERDCIQYEIDLQLNAPHEPLVAPDEIICNLPDADTIQYMKSLSDKQDNTNEICQEMKSAIEALKEVVVIYRFTKRP